MPSRYWPPIIPSCVGELAQQQASRYGESRTPGQQALAGEHGHLRRNCAHVRAAAAELVVVSRRSSYARKCARARPRTPPAEVPLARTHDRLADRETEHRADALAAPVERVPDRLLETRQAHERQLAERLLDELSRSSVLGIRFRFGRLRALDLRVDLLRDLRELAEDLQRGLRILRRLEARAPLRAGRAATRRAAGSLLPPWPERIVRARCPG